MNNKTYQDIAKGFVCKLTFSVSITMFLYCQPYLMYSVVTHDLKYTFIFGILALFCFGSIISESANIWYKENAIAHIKQAISICSPHLSNLEIKELNSQFARVKTRNDYILLDKKLRELAANNQLDLPKFDIL
ncbi:hypothetical protein [Coleofasciculus sp. H7-2]|uniref:hypothetical protein n=1 Tax=Coleofasciculus sp. H7-2 TaxID=3351545 RepID=UPI00366E9905